MFWNGISDSYVYESGKFRDLVLVWFSDCMKNLKQTWKEHWHHRLSSWRLALFLQGLGNIEEKFIGVSCSVAEQEQRLVY
jgi:hypothetical protein